MALAPGLIRDVFTESFDRVVVDDAGVHKEISQYLEWVAPELTGRWSGARRLRLALEMLEQVHPAHLITHRVPITRAAEAYALLGERPYEAIQVILTYGEGDQP